MRLERLPLVGTSRVDMQRTRSGCDCPPRLARELLGSNGNRGMLTAFAWPVQAGLNQGVADDHVRATAFQ